MHPANIYEAEAIRKRKKVLKALIAHQRIKVQSGTVPL